MKAGDAVKVCAGSGLIEDDGATEAVANRKETIFIDVAEFEQFVFGGVKARGHFFGLGKGGVHKGFCIFGMGGHGAVAVHVYGDGGIALLGEHLGAVAGVIV